MNGYTLRQVDLFLKAIGDIESTANRQLFFIQRMAAQGDAKAVEQFMRDQGWS